MYVHFEKETPCSLDHTVISVIIYLVEYVYLNRNNVGRTNVLLEGQLEKYLLEDLFQRTSKSGVHIVSQNKKAEVLLHPVYQNQKKTLMCKVKVFL